MCHVYAREESVNNLFNCAVKLGGGLEMDDCVYVWMGFIRGA